MKRASLVDTLASEFVYGQADANGAKETLDEREQKIPLSEVQLSPLQYRHYIDPAKLVEITDSITKYGQLQAVLVRPHPKSFGYELVFGQTRFLACQKAGTGIILAKVRNLTDAEVVELALIENSHRSNPNPVEETQGILKLLSIRLGKPEAEVIALLNRASTEQKQGSDNVIRSKEWQLVESTFQSFSTLNPESFRVNRLPILNLPEDILEALSQGKVEYTKARAIARMKDDKARQELLEKAIVQDLSLSQIRAKISELKSVVSQGNQSATIQTRFDDIYRQVKKRKIWDDPKKERKLEKMLAQLEALLSEE